MKKDRILNNSLNIIRKYLNEDVPTVSLSSGGFAGTGTGKNNGVLDEKDLPPGRPKSSNKLFRRTRGVQQKYTS